MSLLGPRLFCHHSPPTAPQRQKELWPGCCPRVPDRPTAHAPRPLTLELLRIYTFLGPCLRTDGIAISSTFLTSCSQFGVGDADLSPVTYLISFRYYSHTAGVCFQKSENFMSLCSDSALLGVMECLYRYLVMRYEKTHYPPSPLNRDIYHEVKRVLITTCAYRHA